MNITPQIKDLATARGLDFAVTGGGCDFVIRTINGGAINGGFDLVLSNVDDIGQSPRTLGEKAVVTLNIDVEDAWMAVFAFTFPDVVTAINFMARVETIEEL
jgi:hypothetical protein